LPRADKEKMIDKNHTLSIERQCVLLGWSKSSYYYKPCRVSTQDLALMAAIDKLYTKYPFYGIRRIKVNLEDEFQPVNSKKIGRLMKIMGICAIYPKPRLSLADVSHKVYPYLLRNVKIIRVNQVWSTDITYIAMKGGFLYLCAVVDWYSRKILSWEISNTLTTDFCLKALDSALKTDTNPEIFNTDQGSQFTSNEFLEVLSRQNILISMDGKGRALDNIFIERFWRTIKYEDIYLKEYKTGQELWQGVHQYIQFYNEERKHQSLGYLTPNQVYDNEN
jgi:putative transposase